MTTYTASADANGIILSKTGVPDVSLNWNLFQNQMTAAPLGGSGEFITSQTQFNYFDSIKDGTSGRIQNDLDIYTGMRVGGVDESPTSAATNAWNTTGSNIKHMRNNFTGSFSSNIEYQTWLKLKNSDNYLDPPKIYNYHFWDAGMTAERILKSSMNNASGEPQNSIELASIGTLIDPASGKTETNIARKRLFPSANNRIQFMPSFMNAIGFRGNSFIYATSLGGGGGGGGAVPFQYTMNVGCGTACRGDGNCLITNVAGSPATNHLSNYTIGNNAKGREVGRLGSGPAATKEKVKLIVLKEWGDKMQVMCHLMNYYLGPNGDTTTLLTNDFPVFCLCLNFQLPCIFTGQTEKKDAGVYKPILPDFKRESHHDEGAKDRAYGILTFVPGDPKETLYKKILHIRDGIDNENRVFLAGITKIKDTRRQIKLGGSEVRLTDAYWNIMIADINTIIAENSVAFGTPGLRPANYNDGWAETIIPALHGVAEFRQAAQNNNLQNLVPIVDAFIEDMKKRAYIKRVVKNIKYTAKGGRRRTINSLKLMLFKTYTGLKWPAENGYSFGFATRGPTKKNFSEVAMNYKVPMGGGGVKMKGGAIWRDADWRWFPGDFQGPVLYYEGENDEPGSGMSGRMNGDDNLTQTLFDNLIAPLYRFRDTRSGISIWNINNSEIQKWLDYYDQIVSTIYSQYCYESWIAGQAAVEFRDLDWTIQDLLYECELNGGLLRAVSDKIRAAQRSYEARALARQRRGNRGSVTRRRGTAAAATTAAQSVSVRMDEMKQAARNERMRKLNEKRRVASRGRQLALAAFTGGKKTRKKKKRKRKKTRRRRKKHKRKTRRKR